MKKEISSFISGLRDTDHQIRYKAAVELGKFGSEAKDAIATLILTLRDPHYSVRRISSETLGKIGPVAKEAIPALTETLMYHSTPGRISKKGSNVIRFNTVWALGQIGPEIETLPALVVSLMDDDPEVRSASANTLGLMGAKAKEAIPDLVQALTDTHSQVRSKAIEALEKIGMGEVSSEVEFAVPSLIEALKDRDFKVRRIATQLLKKITKKKYPFQ